MTQWNPNSTTTVGLEWLPTQQGDAPLPAAATFPSTAAETGGAAIDTITAPLGVTGDSLRAIMEVYEAGDEVPGSVSTQIYRPTDDLQIGGDDSEDDSWLTQALGTTNLYQSINEATPDDSDFILYFGPQSPGKRYRFQVGSGAWAAGRRVTGGFVRIRANRLDATGRLQVSYYDGTEAHILGTITVTENIRNFSVPWPEVNPGTGYPWTQAQIQDLAAGGTSAIQLRPINVNKQKSLRVRQAYLSLDYVTEDRVAVGVVDIDPQAAGTPTVFTLRNPNTGADNWAKANSKDYTILIRRTGGFGQAAWRFLTETATTSDALLRPDQNVGLPVQSYVPLLDSGGAVSVMGPQVDGRGQTFWLTRADAAVSVDGQPYGLVAANGMADGALGDGVAQSFTPPNGFDPTVLRLLVSAQVSPTSAAQPFPYGATDEQVAHIPDLDVSVHLSSTDAQVGTTSSVSASDVLASPVVDLAGVFGIPASGAAGMLTKQHNKIWLVEVPIDVPALSNVSYYLKFAADVPSSPVVDYTSWTVVFAANAEVDTAGPPTFQGTGGVAETVSGGTVVGSSLGADIPAMLSTQPSTPAGMGAENVTAATVESDLDGAGCTVPETEVAYIGWTPTALATDFGRYEIERGEPAEFFASFGTMTPGDVVGQTVLTGQTSRSNHIPVIGTDTLDGQSADIAGAFLTGPSFGAWYTWWEVETEPANWGMAFVVEAGSTFNAAAGVICSDVSSITNPVDIAITSVHITVLTVGYQISFYDGAIEPAALTHIFDTPLADDGATIYTFQATIDGNTVTIVDPEGQTESVTDARAARLWGHTLLLEHFQPTATIATDALFDFIAAEADAPGQGTYTQIYYGEDETADQVTDWEAPFGQVSSYRMRVVRNGDWVPSAYTSGHVLTIEPQGAEVAIGSNWLQLAAALNREPEMDWPQPNNDQVLQLAGRDFQYVFQEAENRGDGGDRGFDIDIVGYIGGGSAALLPTPAGRAMFDPLRNFLRAATPYVAVKDWTGDVWYGRATLVDIPETYGEDGSAAYRGQLTVIQTQAAPTSAPIPDPGS